MAYSVESKSGAARKKGPLTEERAHKKEGEDVGVPGDA
jgi:hypothetical protein